MRSALGLVVVLPFLVGFDAPDARQALEAAFHNLYGADTLAAVELETYDDAEQATWTSFAYGRKRVDGKTKTLVYRGTGRRKSGALLFQHPGRRDRIFVTDGRYGQVRAPPSSNAVFAALVPKTRLPSGLTAIPTGAESTVTVSVTRSVAVSRMLTVPSPLLAT